jgi:hypothetical protein
MDLTTPDGVAEYMSQSTSDEDWNRRGQEVKDANNGYPSFWWEVCIKSGLYQRVSGSVPTIGVQTFDDGGKLASEKTYHAVTGEQIA